MTANISEDYATDVSGGLRTNGQGKAIIAGMISIMKETLGGGPEGATVTLASDTATIVNDACIFGLDTEGAAASDNCKAITIGVSGDLRDGMVVGFYNVNSARSITFKNIAGARRIFTRSGRDVVIADTVTIFWAKYKLADDAWYQIIPDVSNMVDLLVGGQPLSTVSISSSAITISSALILVDSASAMHLDQILSTKHVEGNLVGLCSANALQVRTLYHDIGTDDKLDLIGAANIIMAANTWYFFVKTIVSSHVVWKHVWTIYPASTPLGVSTARGQVAISDGAGGWEKLDFAGATDGDTIKYKSANANKFEIGAASSGGGYWNMQAKSVNFTMTADAAGTWHEITAASADIAVTIGASPANGAKYKAIIKSGAYKAVYTADGAEVFYFGDHTDPVLHIVPGAGPVEITACAGGWYVG